MGKSVNSNDPRVKRTRKLIQEAFAALLMEKRFQAISVQDITDRATVNRATFYTHFIDKYDLLDSLMREELQKRLAAQLSLTATLTAANLKTLTCLVFDYLIHSYCQLNPEREIKEWFSSTVRDELQTYVLSWLHHTHQTSEIQLLHLETIATMISWAICGAGLQRDSKYPIPIDKHADQVVALLLEGVAQMLSSVDGPASKINHVLG
ncbi:MAG: hypothetical protein GFH27_549289n205 [Chloroflexi bacterium AL-W]|nr:hypothetical protein [Chloroflexi bacterium AL-N1]NOK66938.1 hypothetical protein [Chloroflexi bacterium AL-N10]NOK74770.1 hypothetical protein [Chloroflexi bacterium AL-N5]NOK81540.1 hypothetical protein [Chloroflexi bacterium AL-W]NOK89010.1 hypothetical protein [Chloroflexi bacterium AL-N15]